MLKKSILFSTALLLFPFMLAGAEVEISDLTTIYYADNTSAGAAKELAGYLSKVFGKKFSLKKAETAEKSGFYIGKSFAPGDVKVEHREQIFRNVTDDGKIFLWGAENSRKIPGDFRAVTTFLENECGVRWLWPTASGEVVPRKKSITVKTGLKSEKPAFAVRILKYGSEANWNRRMKLGQSMDYRVGHAFNSFIHPDKYFKTHPEYFGLVSPINWVGSSDKPAVPTRNPRQLCTTNLDVRRIIAEKVAAKNLDVMQSISPNDGYGFCECANCRAQDADPNWVSIHDYPNLSDRMYDFVKDVALQAKKLNPKSKVLLNAYGFYAPLPKKQYKMPDNVFVLLCINAASVKDRKETEKMFRHYKESGIGLWLYEYWGTYNQGMPWSVINSLAWECKLLKSINGFGMRVENATAFATAGLTNYVGAKMLWNPDADPNEIIDDYCRSGFGKGAKYLREYFDMVEDRTTKIFRYGSQGYLMKFRSIGTFFDDEFFKKGDQLFARALKSGLSAAERARVLYIKSGFDFAKTTAAWSRILTQVNSHGGSLPLVYPDFNEPAELNDAALLALYKKADNICDTRHKQSLAGAMKKDHSITYNPRLERTLIHMPYHFMVQHLLQGVRLGFTNYFVNNAFELRTPPEFKFPVYGWRIDGGKAEVTLTECRDDIHDITAMYHGKQGQSLCVTLPPGESAKITSAVKVVLKSGTDMVVSGCFKNIVPEAKVTFDADGKNITQELPVAATGLKEKTNWQQITFAPFTFPQGKKVSAVITFTVKNEGKTEQKYFFDNMQFTRAK